ncbi:MAG: hypothetical protein DMG89_14465 [Acidobacteria bacterium]|jgi:integrase|nr:MAG: hypothetical protein DMG89_14465 [Acidobacteriota bacterium]
MIGKVTIYQRGSTYYLRYGSPQVREACGTYENAVRRQEELQNNGLSRSIELFISELRASNVSDSHRLNMEWALGKLRSFAEQHRIGALEDFTRDNMAKFRLSLAGTSESKNAMLKRVRSFIRSRLFGEQRDILLSALKAIRKSEADRERLKPRPITPTEIAKLLSIANERQSIFIRLCYQTGLAGVDAIHLERSQIRSGILRTRRRKSGSPVEMRLDPQLHADLIAYADKNSHERFIFSPAKPPHTATIIIRAEVRNLMQTAGIWDSESGCLHRLRDSFVARCIEAGKAPKDVAALIGDRLDTMLRHYADLFEIGREERLQAPPFTLSSEASRPSQ